MKAFAHDNSGARIARRIGRSAGLVAGLVLGGCGAAEQAQHEERVQAYCYRTLAVVDCYAVPLPSQDHRLVGTGTAYVPAMLD